MVAKCSKIREKKKSQGRNGHKSLHFERGEKSFLLGHLKCVS